MPQDDLRSGNHARQLRFVEWLLFGLLMLGLGGVAWQQSRQLQAQAELVSFRATVRALKQALVLAQLQGGAKPAANPFELLERKPLNYAGAMPLGQAAQTLQGQWAFDAGCSCLVYLPRNDWALRNASGAPWVLLQLGGPTGRPSLAAREPCSWLGQPML